MGSKTVKIAKTMKSELCNLARIAFHSKNLWELAIHMTISSSASSQ
jgi:hypothetical protein